MSVYCTACRSRAKRFGRDRHGRQRFACLGCGRRFGYPSTVVMNNLALRKPQAVESARVLFAQGYSVRRVAAMAGIVPKTAQRYRDLFYTGVSVLCACGRNAKHSGWCSWRYGQSEKRQAWMQAWQVQRPRIVRVPCVPALNLVYPYLLDSSVEGADIILRINDAVPRTLSADVRADVCQELACAVLAGSVDIEQIGLYVSEFVRAHYRRYPRKFGPVSLDAPVFGDGTRTLAEVLAG